MIVHVAQLSHFVPLQLDRMDLTEVPSELFRLTNVNNIWLSNNNLCSLPMPSEIAHMTALERLYVRLSLLEAIGS
jgi:Leucine-rich repeat (LRR) protein